MDIPAAEIDNFLAPAPLCGGSHQVAVHEELAALPLRPLASLVHFQELGLQRGEVLVEAPSHFGQFGPGLKDRVASLGGFEL